MKIDFKSFKKKYTKDNTKQFPIGTRVYKGFQGRGKTLSMVHDLFEIKKEFPNCKVFSNLKLKGINYTYFDNNLGLKKAIETENGKDGVLVVIDEAQLFFNKKDGISIDMFTCICQQRKDRRKILFTTQIWEDLDVSLRKQVKEVVRCNNIGRIQINEIYDGESLHWDKKIGDWVANKIYSVIYKHNDDLYNKYDTYQKIVTNKDYERNYIPKNYPTQVFVKK